MEITLLVLPTDGQLRLDGIDWGQACLAVRGKAGRSAQLLLPADVARNGAIHVSRPNSPYPQTRIQISSAMARTILVVDDNVSVGQTLWFILAQRGYEVLIAQSGSEALALAAEHPADAALVDVHMPGMNGIEVCRVLRERCMAAGRTMAVWMITGASTAEIWKQALDAGALAVLDKPFSVAELFKRLDEQFGGVPASCGA